MSSLCARNTDCVNSPDQVFSYNGNGQRVSQKNSAWGSWNQTRNQQVLGFYSKGGKLLLEERQPANLVNEYIYVGGERIASVDSAGVRYYHNDNFGSPSSFSDQTELPSGEDNVKFIGVYKTKESAERAVKRTGLQSGFSEAIDGFYVEKYKLEEDHWKEGFII